MFRSAIPPPRFAASPPAYKGTEWILAAPEADPEGRSNQIALAVPIAAIGDGLKPCPGGQCLSGVAGTSGLWLAASAVSIMELSGRMGSRPRSVRQGGGIVLNKLSLLAAVVVFLLPATVVYAQDQPSVADVARQARKDKEKSTASAKTVLTEDDLGSNKSAGGLGLVDLGPAKPAAGNSSSGASAAKSSDQFGGTQAGSNNPFAGAPASTGDPVADAWSGLDRAQAALDKLAPMDRATLAKLALENNDVDFPNRRNWEERLFAAKENYVVHCRQLLQEMAQLLTSAQALQANPDDPRGQDVVSRAQQILQDATRTESNFKAIISEGQNLAKQAKS